MVPLDGFIIVASIGLRLVGLGYSLWLLYRVKDARFGFLTLMLALMATRQFLSYQTGTSGIDELPGLIVSVLAVLTVYYLAQYVEQEQAIKETIQAKNEQLRTFEKAIEHAGHAIFITDPDGTITYANRAVETVTGYPRGDVIGHDPSMWRSDYHDEAFYRDMWETIESGSIWEGEIVNERRDGERTWVDMTIAPIVDQDGVVEKYVAVDTDVTERKERKARITEQKDRLEVLNRTNEVLRDVNRELVQADSREAIEAAVVKQFADSDQYAFACISDRSVTNETVRPQAKAGIEGEDLERLIGAINESQTNPLETAAQTGSVAIAPCDDAETDWCRPWTERGYRTTAAIPLTYGDTQYGVLCIGTEQADAFQDIETAVFEELGETIGYAINAVESREALLTDSVTEIEVRVTDPSVFPISLSSDLGAELELTWMSPGSEDSLVQYYTVRGVAPETVTEHAATAPELVGVDVITEDESEFLARFEVAESTLARRIGEYGGDLQSIEAADGQARLTIHLSPSADVRTLLEALQAHHGAVDLLARRETERPVPTTEEVRTAIEAALTDRQREALHTAFIAGFFEWPRRNSGEAIAETMGITQSTFLQHLRAAEKKVLTVLLDSDRE
ncbi:MAG: bacterio-opsin activator domain-containing protein [Halobacteriota archaeon]